MRRIKVASFEESFWTHVDKSGDCWIWTAYRNNTNYGFYSCPAFAKAEFGRNWLAHRLSYWLGRGAFDKSLHVLHRCDNPPCVNPDHLFLGTQADNMLDKSSKGRCHKKMPPHVAIAVAAAKAKAYRVIAPDGTLIEGKNIAQLCRDHGLNEGAMAAVIRGVLPHHKRYTRAS